MGYMENAQRIAGVLRKHRSRRGHCICGWKRDLMSFSDHADHVSREVAYELQRHDLTYGTDDRQPEEQAQPSSCCSDDI